MAPSSQARIFMTGASGYIGRVITEFAVAQGYEVYGLCRTEKSDEILKSLGAVPVRGDVQSLDVLRRESSSAQIVIHLVNVMGPNLDANEALRIDAAAVDAICESLSGTQKPFLVTSGSLLVSPDPNGGETTETSAMKPSNAKSKAEQYALDWARKAGTRVISIRLAPYVYGRGGSGLRRFMQMFVGLGEVVYIGEGNASTSTVHVDDAARLYLLAAEKGGAGEIYNCTSSTYVTAYQLAEAMSSILGLPLKSIQLEEAEARFGKFLANFFSVENRASSAKAKRDLGWQPYKSDILDEIKTGSYLQVAEEIKHK